MNNLPDKVSVKQELEIKTIRRKARLEKIEDHLSFVATKGTGGIFLTSGILEILSPEVIAAVVPNPFAFVGAGLALISGKAAGKLLDNLRKAMD